MPYKFYVFSAALRSLPPGHQLGQNIQHLWLIPSSCWQTSSVWGKCGSGSKDSPFGLLEGSTYSFLVGVATVSWAASLAVRLHEQAGGGGGHRLSALMVSASLCKCLGDLNCSDGYAGSLVKLPRTVPVWNLTTGKVSHRSLYINFFIYKPFQVWWPQDDLTSCCLLSGICEKTYQIS